ncbi:hypothetical protein GOP47_0000509 [Adiantum capillus-veneris]|uniref:Uncharacterized protein n=1 Tax=Adiantum capillus-veneris TaxID=13818 RepID=A0A9D4ZT55_ADICA|nr:hypothetical protein GOP47_0000509 [Adiantum capillus-veneris]
MESNIALQKSNETFGAIFESRFHFFTSRAAVDVHLTSSRVFGSRSWAVTLEPEKKVEADSASSCPRSW